MSNKWSLCRSEEGFQCSHFHWSLVYSVKTLVSYSLLEFFHGGMEAPVGGSLIETIKAENRVKQGDLLAPTLFSIYFAIVLLDAFED